LTKVPSNAMASLHQTYYTTDTWQVSNWQITMPSHNRYVFTIYNHSSLHTIMLLWKKYVLHYIWPIWTKPVISPCPDRLTTYWSCTDGSHIRLCAKFWQIYNWHSVQSWDSHLLLSEHFDKLCKMSKNSSKNWLCWTL